MINFNRKGKNRLKIAKKYSIRLTLFNKKQQDLLKQLQ